MPPMVSMRTHVRPARLEPVADLGGGAAHGVVVDVHQHLGAGDRDRLPATGERADPEEAAVDADHGREAELGGSPWVPPKLRLDTKLSQRRAPHEWSRQAGASTSAFVPSSSTVPRTRQKTWKLLEKMVPAVPGRPGERLRVGEGPRALVGDLELGAAALAVEHEAQPLAVEEEALRPGAQCPPRRGGPAAAPRRCSGSGSRARGRRRTTGWPCRGSARCRCGGSRPGR